ncbi:MAG: ketoacyl-ACP synthase III [Rikenellaceae bacterium]
MAFQNIKNVKIVGISATVPKHKEDNLNLEILGTSEDRQKFVDATGIRFRHTVADSGLCTSDLCYSSAEKLIEELQWDKSEIDCLIFVTQTPDYVLPATSCILQNRLGLSQECFAMDISLGCSGWVYGLATISALISAGGFKKGLLLSGDTVTMTKSPRDKSTYPLFGDAGTATALTFDTQAKDMKFHFGTDGSNSESIIIKDGGFRNVYTPTSSEYFEAEPGVFRTNMQSVLNGAQVFTFGITKAPKSIKALLEYSNKNIEEIDYLLLHQANTFMTNKISKKAGADINKVPYSIGEYGNTSSASIPLTMVTQLNDKLTKGSNDILACGFGVGFSWGSTIINLDTIKCPTIIEI